MRLLWVVPALAALGCAVTPIDRFETVIVDEAVVALAPEGAVEGADRIDNRALVGKLGLRSGQIVVSEQGGADSLFVSLMAQEYRPFVHAGIVAIDDGEPYVYEQNATLWPHLSGPPTRAMSGSVRRVPLAEFLARHRVVGLHSNPAGTDGDAVAGFAREHHRRGTAFDPFFDSDDPRAMYCTEFVALGLAAGGARVEPVPLTRNESVATVLRWLDISTDRIHTAGSLVAGAPRIALLAPRDSPDELAMYFELRRELHRRFTPDQKLGNLLHWSWSGLKLREGVRTYLRAGLAAARAGTPADDAARVVLAKLLAVNLLGPYEEPAQLVQTDHVPVIQRELSLRHDHRGHARRKARR